MQHAGSDSEKIGNIFASVLGDDVREIKIVISRDVSIDGTTMVFVECRDINFYIPKLITNRSIVGVVPSFKNPTPIPQKELNGFFKSVVSREHRFSAGDFVKPISGYLSGLFGMVLAVKNNKAEVLFRFHMRNITEKLQVDQLNYQYSISDVSDESKSDKELIRLASGSKYAYNNKLSRKKKKAK